MKQVKITKSISPQHLIADFLDEYSDEIYEPVPLREGNFIGYTDKQQHAYMLINHLLANGYEIVKVKQ